ncbi:MAG: hypothetical protein M1830_003406 [Pleopsidium flavum]|nr:MAG: hypothetical protein M1830_003406 [Pleopsidium flavum]
MTYPRQIPPAPLVTSQSLMTPSLDLSMSIFSDTGMGYPMSLASNSYTFGSVPPSNLFSATSYNAVLLHSQFPTLATVGRSPHNLPQVREARNGLSTVDQRPLRKAENALTLRPNGGINAMSSRAESKLPTGAPDVDFGTDVDSLMRAIQTKSKPKHHSQQQQQQLPTCRPIPPQHRTTQQESPTTGGFSRNDPGARKRYQCHLPTCAKSFFQKTHLEIHMRAHTGDKPFTHERRHTGERPYSCESCGKRFAQRGNVRAHRIVHEQGKPFLCKLEGCGKRFTQLGNLKSHQNKFHSESLRNLTLKFASMREGDPVTVKDKELWEYFATLYKNSNKGIKGRGKDRRISAIANSGSHTVKQERADRSGSSSASTNDGQPDVFDLDGSNVDGDSSVTSYSNDDQDFAFADRKMF